MIWIIGELVLLYFISRHLTNTLYRLVYLVTLSRRVPISILALLFFPGTVVHEISHWFIAGFLRVRTGRMVLYPIIEKEGHVRLGSVEIEKVDQIRRLFIGVAPLVVGMTLLLAISEVWLFPTFIKSFHSIPSSSLGNLYLFQRSFDFAASNAATLKMTKGGEGWHMLLLFYTLFVVGNTMFSSKRDIEGLWLMAIILLALGVWLYTSHLWMNILQLEHVLIRLRDSLQVTLGIVIVIDGIVIALLYIMMRLVEKMLRRKVR